MAFEIGERVTNSFTGPGTVIGSLERDEDNIAVQRVKFDTVLLGERNHFISQLRTLEPENEPKSLKIKKTSADIDLDAALTEGLTYFTTNPNIKRDDPKLKTAVFLWFGVELANRPTRITIYATPVNGDAVVKELMALTGWDYDTAHAHITIRDRKGGPKWNIDFPNFQQLGFDIRDALNVNFNHFSPGKDVSDIRRIRIGSTKLVQELVKTGFGNTIQKAGGDEKKED